MADDKDTETWIANGRVVIRKMDRSGRMTSQLINRGKKFTITEQERLINQDHAASAEQDVFQNGMLAPVRLIDGSDAVKAYAENPNTMSESDMEALFRGHWKTFEKKVGQVNSPLIVKRMLGMAEKADASLKQVSLLKNRLNELEPNTVVERESAPLAPSVPAATTAVSPQSSTPNVDSPRVENPPIPGSQL